MSQHHHYEEFLHSDGLLDEHQDLDDSFEGLEYQEHEKMEHSSHHHHNARRSIDEYLEKKRMREQNRDPFDDFFDED